MSKTPLLTALLAGLLLSTPAAAQEAQNAYSWITLGTMGGPMPRPGRHEPANLLWRKGEAHLIDTGDGAMTGLADAGADYPNCAASGSAISISTIWAGCSRCWACGFRQGR
jgi:hypothetical protein